MNSKEAIAVSENQQNHVLELQRQQLLRDCHGLIAAIGQKPYSNKLLRSARESLEKCLEYKANRGRQKIRG